MALLDFYAVADDLRSVVQFLLSETDVVLYEHYSRYDHEVRRFGSLSELEAACKLGTSRFDLQLWSPSVMVEPVIKRISLTGVPGHSFRYAVHGAGLIQLYFEGIRKGVIYHTHYGHWNEAGARERSIFPPDDCDWRALSKLSGRVQRYIRGRLAPATFHCPRICSRPILRHAFAAVQEGAGLWFGPEVHRTGSPFIQAKHAAPGTPANGGGT